MDYRWINTNIDEHEFLTGKDKLPEKRLVEKASESKQAEYALVERAFNKKVRIVEKR